MRPVAFASVTLACMLLAPHAFAQITPWSNPATGPGARGIDFTLFGALALPEGDFSSTASSHAGFARPGGGLGLDFTARYPGDIETGALFLADLMPVDRDALGASVVATLRRSGSSSDPQVVSVGMWQTTWGLVKAGYAPRVGAHLRASVDIYGGVLYGHQPEVKLLAPPPQGALIQYDKSWYALATGAGTSMRWRNHLSIGLLYLSGALRSTWRNPLYGPILRQPFSTLHATLGYAFGH